ncbi:MAG TPA: hypothetical protein VF041_00345 [Gemmatimonadaceae bacterium]
MPSDSISDREHSLGVVLAARARRASDGRLAIDAAAGVVAIVAALIWRPPGWGLVAALAGCFLAFGAWGIADRSLVARGGDAGAARLLGAVRAAAVVLGALSGVALLVIALGLGLGRMIS